MTFPDYFRSQNDDYVRYIRQRAKLLIQKAKGEDVEGKLNNVNGIIYAIDKPFSQDSIVKFDTNFEESAMMLRQHTGGGKDIKNYTVIEYFTLLKILEKQNKNAK